MLEGKKTMQLIKYTPESIKRAGVRLVEEGEVQVVSFYARKLIIALARTILALQPKDKDIVYQAISSYSALYPLISDREEFGFVENIEMKIRDYLLSTRTGELAPAIGYLFAQEQLGKPFVVDFSIVLMNKAVQTYPDLVALNSKGELAFIESKGSRDIRNKGKLREALSQSEQANALSIIEANDFYGLFISVTKSDKEESSAIHYSFTTNEEKQLLQDVRALIYRHYATWFMLLGYEKEARKLVDGQSVKLKKMKKEIHLKGQVYYELEVENALFFDTCNQFCSQFRGAQFLISANVVAYLRGGEELNLPHEKAVQKIKSTVDLFSDGTAILYKEV